MERRDGMGKNDAKCLWATCGTPIGELTMASDGESLVGLWIEGQRYHGGPARGLPEAADGMPLFRDVTSWLNAYFAGKRPSVPDLPLAPCGSDFRQAVWGVLREIPYGETVTYGQIARLLEEAGGKASARAVGGAVGHNPISVIIPCHRVIGAGGNLTGYAGGIKVKSRLLALEGVDLSSLYFPKRGTAL
ncbi:MAG: methylated-DNA--[protein]-cysteine S-methyltransferase [Deltaproteobacteria bacterium]|nr:methylated-DNA--[protein]-cysteine S-methyltransferase [Deltaproteobacteria bacterium]